MTRTTRVRSHMRNGRRVRSYSQTRQAWQQAGIAWAGTAASGATTLALVVQLGFALVSAIAVILTVLLGAWTASATAKATAPRRRMRAKTRPRPAARKRPATRKRTKR